jgi:hypothetical protein
VILDRARLPEPVPATFKALAEQVERSMP